MALRPVPCAIVNAKGFEPCLSGVSSMSWVPTPSRGLASLPMSRKVLHNHGRHSKTTQGRLRARWRLRCLSRSAWPPRWMIPRCRTRWIPHVLSAVAMCGSISSHESKRLTPPLAISDRLGRPRNLPSVPTRQKQLKEHGTIPTKTRTATRCHLRSERPTERKPDAPRYA